LTNQTFIDNFKTSLLQPSNYVKCSPIHSICRRS